MQELIRQATKIGLKFTLQPAHWPVNQAPASYGFIAAQNAGSGKLGNLAHGMTRACWAEESNIAEEAVIRECLVGAWFDLDWVETGVLMGAEEYAANLEQAVEAGAFGTPFYILDNGQRFWGQDRLEDLDAHLAGDL